MVKQFKKGLQTSSVDVSRSADRSQNVQEEPFTGIKTTVYPYGTAAELWNAGKVEKMIQLEKDDQKWTFSKYDSRTKTYSGTKEWDEGKYEGCFDRVGQFHGHGRIQLKHSADYYEGCFDHGTQI